MGCEMVILLEGINFSGFLALKSKQNVVSRQSCIRTHF